MALDLGKVLRIGVLICILIMVYGGPARSLAMDGGFADEDLPQISDEGTVKFDGIYDDYEEDSGPGVLGRLWTGISSKLNLFGSGALEDKLNRFRTNSMSNLREGVREFQVIRLRQKRAHPLSTILTRDTKGYHKLLPLDQNVEANLRSFVSPPNPISMEVFEHLNFVFWLITDDYGVGNRGSLYVYMLDVARHTLQWTQASSYGAKKCVPVLKIDTFIEIVCVETQGHEVTDSIRKGIGSGVYRITWSSGLTVEFRRALKTRTAQDVAVWEFDGSSYIAFANSYDPSLKSGEILSVVYQLQTTNHAGVVYPSYDFLDNAGFSTKHAYGLEAFKIVSKQFLAVANHRDDNGNVEIDSIIYVYDLNRQMLNPFQRIKTSGARDWTAFSFTQGPSSEYFLVVANEYRIDENGNKDYEVDSVIYKFHYDKFVPFQCIRTNGARQWIVYQGSEGEFLLAVVNGQSGVFFYQYNGWRFVQADFKVSGVGVEYANFAFLPNTLNRLVLSVVNPFEASNRPLTYYVSFRYENPLGEYYNNALAWCQSLSRKLASDGLGDLVRRLEAATKVDDPRNFTSAVTIKGNLRVTSSFANVLNIIVLSQGIRLDSGIEGFSSLRRVIDDALNRLAVIKQLLQDAKKMNSQTDLDGVRFSKVRLICTDGGAGGRCSVDSLIANTVNGISAAFDGALSLHQDNHIQTLNLAELIVDNGGQITVDYVSGPGLPRTAFSDIVTLTGNHIIFGQKTFGKIQANFLVVSGTVGGIRISRDNLLLTVMEQRVNFDLSVESLRAKSIILRTLNGRDFTSFFSNLVLNGANQKFSGPLIINGDLIAPSITTVNPVTPLDPLTASNRALFHNTGATQIITGSHKIRELQALQGITVEGTINGISVPDDLYLRTSNEIINRPVTFQDLVADMVTVTGMLGDVQVIGGELDLLLLNGDQIVSGRKTFDEITILGHSTLDGLVTGYNLEDLTADVGEEFIRGINSGRRILGSVTFNGGLTVQDDLVDGVSISRILNNAVSLDASRISNQITFDGPVQVNGDLRITNSLNGINIDDYVLKDGTYVLTGDVTFTTSLVAKGNIEAGTVNGYDLSTLVSQFVLLDGARTITGDVTLHSPEFLDLSVSGEIVVNGVNLDDLVFLNSDAVITGEKTFTTLSVFSSVKASSVSVGQFGTVDGVVISDLFFSDSLRKTGTTTQHLVGRSLNVVVAESASGTNLASLQRRVVYKDRAESINGSLTFTGPVTVRDLTFNGDFDGITPEEYMSGFLLKTGSQTLTGRNYFFGLNSRDVVFTGSLLQGTDFNDLLKNTAKIDEATTLNAIAFDFVLSMSPIQLDGRIQGFKLREDALLKNGVNQVVTGLKTFWGPIRYSGKFTIDGKVYATIHHDDVPVVIDVGSLCQGFLVSEDQFNLGEVTVDGDVFFGGNVNITDSFNGLDVRTLGSTFWLADNPAYIPGSVRFSNVEIAPSASLIVDGLLNGIDIRSLWENILKKECDQQSVSGEFYIESLTVDSIETDRLTNSDDDLGLNNLLNILLRDGDQDISGLFTFSKLETRDSVILQGTLNGLRVDTDFVQYNRPTTITARKTFQSLVISGDLSVEVGGTVQGVDVSELVRNAVSPDIDGSGNCFIPGTTTFKGLRFEDSGTLEVRGTVDGVYLNSSRVLLKSADQVVLGPIALNGQTGLETLDTLTVLDDKFNEIVLSRLQDLTVRSNRPNVFEAAVTFIARPTFTTVTISNHLINGYNITDLSLCLSGNHIVSNMGDQFALILQAARDAKDMLADKAVELWYFRETVLSPVDRLLPVSLTAQQLLPHTYDTLVGLDLSGGVVSTYRIESGFPKLFRDIPITMPLMAVGLSNNLLATCGKVGMTAYPSGSTPSFNFKQVPLESGEGTGFGHVHAFSGSQVSVEVAFGIDVCKDLVSFTLPDNRMCLAVIDYAASSTVMCRTAGSGFYFMNYLGTTRAVKGAWLSLDYRTYLLVVEKELGYAPAYLKVFSYNSTLNQMVKVNEVELSGADDVDAILQGTGAVIAVTSMEQELTYSSITIFTAYHQDSTLVIETLQIIQIRDIHHCSFSLMPTGEVGLFIQTFYSVRLYLWKCIEFRYAREIRTDPAVWPSSVAFLYNTYDTDVLLVAFAASGSLDPLTKEHDNALVKTKLFTAVYRGSSQTVPVLQGSTGYMF